MYMAVVKTGQWRSIDLFFRNRILEYVLPEYGKLEDPGRVLIPCIELEIGKTLSNNILVMVVGGQFRTAACARKDEGNEE